jgi:hypothetical protein
MAMHEPQISATGTTGSELLRGAVRAENYGAGLSSTLRERIFPHNQRAFRDDDLSLIAAMAERLMAQLREAFERDTGATIDPAYLRPNAIIDDVIIRVFFARAVESRIVRAMPSVTEDDAGIPVFIVDSLASNDPVLVEAAMEWLASQSRFISGTRAYRLDLSELPPELLNHLVWRSVNHLQSVQYEQMAVGAVQLRASAEAILRSFEEAQGRSGRTAKLLHFAPISQPFTDWDIALHGPSLAIAILAREVGIDRDTLFHMVAEPGLHRLAVLLRSMETDPDIAVRLLHDISNIASNELDPSINQSSFAGLDISTAQSLAARWCNQQADPSIASNSRNIWGPV